MRGRIVDLVVLLALSFLCVSWTAAEAQPAKRVPTIGGLSGGVPPSEAQSRQAPCWPARHERSWVEGQHSTVERRDAEGPRERLQGLAAELVQLPVDVILATGPQAARAAQAASDTSPIVFMAAGDPGRAGLVARLAHPGGNMTGLSAVSPELSEKRLALLKEAAPGSSRVAVLPNADVNYLRPEMTHMAPGLGVTLDPINGPAADPLASAGAAMMAAHVEALLVLTAPRFLPQWRRGVALAATRRLPRLYPSRYVATGGGLMS